MQDSEMPPDSIEPQFVDPLTALADRCTEDARLFLEVLQTHPHFAAVIETLMQLEGALHEEHIAQALLNRVKNSKR